MYSRVIDFKGVCRNCKSLNGFSTHVMSEEPIINPSLSELMETINHNTMGCPDCGRRGNITIIFFKFFGLIYNMQTRPQVGKIILQAEKVNSKLNTCNLGADNDNFSLYDFYNALTIFDNELQKLNKTPLSKEQEDLKSLQTLSDGGLIFASKLKEEPPYIIPFGINTYGFSYEEIDKIVTDLKEKIRNRLNKSQMPY